MVSALLPLIALSTALTLVQSAGINFLPHDAAEELRELASSAGWYAANIRKNYYGDASNDDASVRQHIANFKSKMEGIVSPAVADKIRHMFGSAGWHTANTRVGYHSDARHDKDKVNSLYREIVNSGELSTSLVSSIRSMGWAAAWYSANKRAGYNRDASRDASQLRDCFDKIYGTVRLIRAKFLNDDLRVSQETPKFVCDKTLPNCGETESQVVCSGTETMGRTISITRTISFEYSVAVGFTLTASVFGIGAETSLTAQFTISQILSIEQSFQHAVSRSYEFTIKAAPHTTNTGKGIVQEARGSVPYELVFDFGGVEKTVHGVWEGVLVSRVLFKTRGVPHDPSACLR